MKYRKLVCSGEAIVENCVLSIWANFITFPESISKIQGLFPLEKQLLLSKEVNACLALNENVPLFSLDGRFC